MLHPVTLGVAPVTDTYAVEPALKNFFGVVNAPSAKTVACAVETVFVAPPVQLDVA